MVSMPVMIAVRLFEHHRCEFREAIINKHMQGTANEACLRLLWQKLFEKVDAFQFL